MCKCRLCGCVTNCSFRYVGIIDFLQQWNLQKRAERNWKVAPARAVVRHTKLRLTASLRCT
jgi:hypothetical protein